MNYTEALNTILRDCSQCENDINIDSYSKKTDHDISMTIFSSDLATKKMSVVCKYSQPSSVTGYYGLHPSVDINYLLGLIKKDVFDSTINFERFVDTHYNDPKIVDFSCTNQLISDNYVKAMLAKMIMQQLLQYCIMIDCTNLNDQSKFVDNLESALGEGHCVNKLDDYVTLQLTLSYGKIRGILNLPYSYFIDDANNCVVVFDKDDNVDLRTYQLIDSADQLLTLITMVDYAYYSGVLPRVESFSVVNSHSNPDISTLRISVFRSTYATVNAFDNVKNYNNPFLKSYSNEYQSIVAEESRLRNKLLDNLDEIFLSKTNKAVYASVSTQEINRNIIEQINIYLSKSIFPHNLAVSGNIITKDHFLLFTKRHKSAIDSNQLYCSVNGQTEFFDHHVKFYFDSSFEDVPSLIANQYARNDFDDELSRETIAELNINLWRTNWKYYGVALLAGDTRNNDSDFRCHFNILAHNKAEETFIDVCNRRRTANEKFENESLHGIKIISAFSARALIKDWLSTLITTINENLDIIGLLISTLFLISNLVNKQARGINFNSLDFFGWFNLFSTCIVTLALIIRTFKKARTYVKHKILTKTIFFFVRQKTISLKTIKKTLKKFRKRNLLNKTYLGIWHPIFTTMLVSHLYYLFEHRIEGEGE